MEFDEISELERIFTLELPEDYKAALLDDPLDGESEGFVSDFSYLKETNDGLRSDPLFWGVEWFPRYWCIGQDGAGGIYFINSEEIESNVYYFDHEDTPKHLQDYEMLSPRSFKEHIDELIQIEIDFEQDKYDLIEKIKNRRWWQIWILVKPPKWCS